MLKRIGDNASPYLKPNITLNDLDVEFAIFIFISEFSIVALTRRW